MRLLRAVFSADGMVDPEEARTIAAFVGSLGLSETDAAPMFTEAPVAIEHMDVYGEIEPALTRAPSRGAWLAAAWDAIDPREEAVVREFAKKLSVPDDEVEAMRQEAIKGVDARRIAGLATVDAVRFMLSDRMPGAGVQLAAKAGTLMLPRRFREEALAQVGHGQAVVLAKRYTTASSDERQCILGIAWAAGMWDDPATGRRALLRARHDRLAADLGDDGARVRAQMDEWMAQTLAPVAFNMK